MNNRKLTKIMICEQKNYPRNVINKKDPILKSELQTNYKRCRNLLTTFMKKSKQAYYDKYFERNWNSIKHTWK